MVEVNWLMSWWAISTDYVCNPLFLFINLIIFYDERQDFCFSKLKSRLHLPA